MKKIRARWFAGLELRADGVRIERLENQAASVRPARINADLRRIAPPFELFVA
jgi:hypothetical protein